MPATWWDKAQPIWMDTVCMYVCIYVSMDRHAVLLDQGRVANPRPVASLNQSQMQMTRLVTTGLGMQCAPGQHGLVMCITPHRLWRHIEPHLLADLFQAQVPLVVKCVEQNGMAQNGIVCTGLF